VAKKLTVVLYFKLKPKNTGLDPIIKITRVVDPD
jgi:hypothetical protein